MSLNKTTVEKPFLSILWIPPALLFIAAALSKAADPIAFLYELADYGFNLPMDFEALLALLLPPLEGLLGVTLLFGRNRWAALGAILLLLIFSVGIITGLPDGYLQRCGCLGPENLAPGITIAKNLLAIILLAAGFKGNPRWARNRNYWGSFAFVAAACWADVSLLLMIYGLGALLAALDGKKHLPLYLIGLGLGWCFYLFELPLLLLPCLGTFYYLIKIESNPYIMRTAILVCFSLLVITFTNLVQPPSPEAEPPFFQTGQPWPQQLIPSYQLPADRENRTLVVLLSPDCDACRLWLPLAASISQRSELPPLVGLAPESPEKIRAYRRRETISFPILSVDSRIFDRAVERTPLLVFVEHDTVHRVFTEGRLPPPSSIKEIVFDEKK